MGIKRVVDTDFWMDDKVIDMFSPEDKLFMLYLLTNPHTTQLGIYPINRKVIAFELGYSLEAVCVLLDRFETKYDIIRYSKVTGEVAVKNYLRHSIIKGGKPVEDLLKKEILNVKDKSLLAYVHCELSEHDNLNEAVKNSLYLMNDNENDNDNDNDVSLPIQQRFVDDSSKPKRKRFTPPTLEEVKAYCEERNNNVDAERFIDYYSANGWVQGKGKPIKDWKACIRTWEKNNTAKKDSSMVIPMPDYMRTPYD